MDTPNINFIPTAPKYSDAELDDALITEVFNQHEKKFQKEKIREEQTAKEAKTNVGKTHPALGKCVANFPYPEYMFLLKKYGRETVHSPEFLKDYNKRFPHLSPNKA
jgi:hypothetical protein